MRAVVDVELCIGCGLCAGTAPEVFEMDGALSHVVADSTDLNRDAVLEAIEGCPVGAIREEE